MNYCEVALPVPLDRVFTYAVDQPVERGVRVIVPFRAEKLIGVVTAAGVAEPTDFVARPIEAVLDPEPLLDEPLIRLAEWMAQYYLAPVGEVLRGMLPLMAEVRRTICYRLTDLGRDALAAAVEGVTRRGKIDLVDEQGVERRVLELLSDGEAVRASRLKTATGATVQVLGAMMRRKWIQRLTEASERDARRTERFVVMVDEVRLPQLTDKQQAVLAELAAAGGEMRLADLRERPVSQSSLETLVRKGLLKIEERSLAFRLGGLTGSHLPLKLNEPQMEALASITMALGGFKSFLLHGVTGSGKTAVYLAAMQKALDRGESALLLVPEIGLTPQTAGLLDAAFGSKVALLHSALTPEERSEQWRRIRRGEAPIVVGTRSAIFAPAPRLGLILVDEEHDGSYKQEETPRYNARDVAVMRAKIEGAVVVLGSATPSLETWQNAETGRYERITMSERVGGRPLPEVELVDMRKEFQETGREQLFSRTLVEQTQAALERGEQAIILLNRRGYSFAVMCRSCGEKLECTNCAIALTHHKPPSEDGLARAGQRLECHYCGYKRTVPEKCPKCQSEHLYYLGAGSQQGEERLAEIFPGARIGRMDRDTVRGRGDLERLLERLHSGEINLLVGTQMIAKGHDIHGVTLVGVVGCDHSLSMPEFRAAERVFQLMTQVSGRAGRGELRGRVVVQTYHTDHYAIQAAARHDFHAFVEQELKYRRWMHYPPFGALANVMIQSADQAEAVAISSAIGKWLRDTKPEGVRVLGPCTAPIARIKNIWRFHLIVKADKRSALNGCLRALVGFADGAGIDRKNLIVDVDALRLM